MTIGYIHNYANINTISDNLYTYIFRSSAMHNIILGLVFPNVEQKRNVVFMQSICGMLTIILTVLIQYLLKYSILVVCQGAFMQFTAM